MLPKPSQLTSCLGRSQTYGNTCTVAEDILDILFVVSKGDRREESFHFLSLDSDASKDSQHVFGLMLESLSLLFKAVHMATSLGHSQVSNSDTWTVPNNIMEFFTLLPPSPPDFSLA